MFDFQVTRNNSRSNLLLPVRTSLGKRKCQTLDTGTHDTEMSMTLCFDGPKVGSLPFIQANCWFKDDAGHVMGMKIPSDAMEVLVREYQALKERS